MTTLLSLSLAMVIALVLNRLVKLANLPNVTGYLIAGLIVGPFCCDFINTQYLSDFKIITTVALGFIAFSIGSEFQLSSIRHIGKRAITTTMFEALTAVLFVNISLRVAGFDPAISLTLGAISAATAPAATLMVVRQYKASGPVTQTLLPVVALDDAVGLMVYSVSIALAKTFCSDAELTFYTCVVAPIVEIVLSLLIGAVIGGIMTLCMKLFHSRANRLCVMLAAVFLGVAVAEKLDLSALLLCMMIGAVFCNLSKEADKVLDGCERWTPPLFMLFFVISGAGLDFSVLKTVGLLGAMYIIFRSLGKYLGAFIGSTVVKAEPNIRKYLGITLLPQAGVAVGMAQMVMSELPAEYANKIRAVILCATLIYELFGPVMTKIALTKAGEIPPKEKKSKQAKSA
ncbi:MAG TPA: cation/H(+) antiporter [Ruminococcaceae bacterium]|nr:cation/H(+) antiporter [Oscillospiraceae bacterium]